MGATGRSTEEAMTYDSWKARHPDDEIDFGDPPEGWVQ